MAATPTVDTDSTVAMVGRRIREARVDRDLTLQGLGERTGLSASMLSLVERGKTSPSIGTLVAIASALNIHMADLFNSGPNEGPQPVLRVKDQPVYDLGGGAKRRVVRTDDERGLELVFNEYEPGAASGKGPLHHEGFEYGILLEGRLTVIVNGESYELKPGDCIAYDSHLPHEILNKGKRRARAFWVNLQR